MPKAQVAKKASTAKHKSGGGGGSKQIKGAAKNILDVAAAVSARTNKAEVSREQVILLIGKLGKSTIGNAFTALSKAGLLIITPKTLTVTSMGMDAADVDAANITIPTTNAELHDSIKETYKLNKNQLALFDYLADGGTYNKKEVKAALKIPGKSTFANLLTNLKKMQIVEFDRDTIKLTDKMFEIEGRP